MSFLECEKLMPILAWHYIICYFCDTGDILSNFNRIDSYETSLLIDNHATGLDQINPVIVGSVVKLKMKSTFDLTMDQTQMRSCIWEC